MARVYGATRSDREDLFQEIALQLWHSVEAWRGDCSSSTWIYRVALNMALAWRRKERRHRDGREDIEDASGLLVALLLDGFSYREMAQLLGLSESNIGVKINRIKAALAARLAQGEGRLPKEVPDGL